MKPQLSHLPVELFTAKMIQSKIDGRMAVIIGMSGDLDPNNMDQVTINMERIGERTFSLRTINTGFAFLNTIESAVRALVKNHYTPSDMFHPTQIFRVSCQVFDAMEKWGVDGVTNEEVFKVIEDISRENNAKGGL